MFKFKVGDRVAYTEKFGSRTIGEEGTVIRVNFDTVEIRHERSNGSGNHISIPYTRRIRLVSRPNVERVAPKAPLPDAIYLVAQSADRIFPRRSYDTILKSLMEEMGELSTEIAIAQGTKKRSPSSDGVKGEAVDVFVVAVDMLRAAWGDALFTTEFTDKVKSKLAKWERV